MLYISKKERVSNAKELIRKGMSPQEASQLTGICIVTARYIRDSFCNNEFYDHIATYCASPTRILH
jgi:hypothetical protein